MLKLKIGIVGKISAKEFKGLCKLIKEKFSFITEFRKIDVDMDVENELNDPIIIERILKDLYILEHLATAKFIDRNSSRDSRVLLILSSDKVYKYVTKIKNPGPSFTIISPMRLPPSSEPPEIEVDQYERTCGLGWKDKGGIAVVTKNLGSPRACHVYIHELGHVFDATNHCKKGGCVMNKGGYSVDFCDSCKSEIKES